MSPVDPSVSPRKLPDGMVARFFRGASYPISALGFIKRQKLWLLALAPALVNALLFGVLLSVTLLFLVPLLQDASVWLEGLVDGSSWLRFLTSFASGLLWTVGLAVMLLLNILLLMLVGQAVAAPFLDLLSERVEAIVLGTEEAPFSVPRMFTALRISLGDLVWSLVYFAKVNAPLAVLGMLLPPVSTFIATVLGFLFSALLLAQEFIGLSWARQLIPFRQRWLMMRQGTVVSLGFGSACMLLVAVPVLNLVLLPVAATGGTLLYCDLVAANKDRPRY